MIVSAVIPDARKHKRSTEYVCYVRDGARVDVLRSSDPDRLERERAHLLAEGATVDGATSPSRELTPEQASFALRLADEFDTVSAELLPLRGRAIVHGTNDAGDQRVCLVFADGDAVTADADADGRVVNCSAWERSHLLAECGAATRRDGWLFVD